MDQHCILIVDDDPGIRLLLVTYLRQRGFQLLEAHNGREALAIMRAVPTDLVVMDLAMPEVSGWDVLRERTADASLRRIPVIIMTANNVRDVTARMAVKHVHAVLEKPFDLVALLAAVTTCLGDADQSAHVAA